MCTIIVRSESPVHRLLQVKELPTWAQESEGSRKGAVPEYSESQPALEGGIAVLLPKCRKRGPGRESNLPEVTELGMAETRWELREVELKVLAKHLGQVLAMQR